MQVSLSSVRNQYNNFRAQQPQKSTNVLENTISEKDKIEIQSKKVKNAVKCCVGVVLAADILYFAMKRKIKFSKILKEASQLAKSKDIPAPISTPPKLMP